MSLSKVIVKNLFFFISVCLNIIAVLFVIYATTVRSTTLDYFFLGTKTKFYTHSAFVVSVPEENADVQFGPVEFTLKKGYQAALQFSFIYNNNKQSNLVFDTLYDPGVIRCEPSGYGLIITALNSGASSIQTFSGGEFRDLAIIYVYE